MSVIANSGLCQVTFQWTGTYRKREEVYWCGFYTVNNNNHTKTLILNTYIYNT